VTRRATLSDGGWINEENVAEEIARLRQNWSAGSCDDAVRRLLGDGADALDLFERGQLNLVIDVCRRAGSLSAAGRMLFAVSRLQKSQANDADRLRKYLARFGLDWSSVTG